MPLFEYICPNCNTIFEKLQNQPQEVPCPECGRPAKKKVSLFSASSSACTPPAGSGFG